MDSLSYNNAKYSIRSLCLQHHSFKKVYLAYRVTQQIVYIKVSIQVFMSIKRSVKTSFAPEEADVI